MSKVVEGLLYSKDHEWVKMNGSEATVGITDYAQDSLGEIVYVELPEVDEQYNAKEEIANVESVKAASAIYSPLTGKINSVNEALEDSPELLNEDCYANYIFKMTNIKEMNDGELLDAVAYKDFLKTLD